MRGGDGERFALIEAFEDRLRQRRALDGVGARAKLVQQTSERSSASARMRTVFVICEENVDSDCSMDCSSPISANTLSNVESSVPSSAGMNMPLIAMSENSPTVLSVTVLPPVFGPVMMSVLNVSPSQMSTGTTVCLSISGCRPARCGCSPFR
jgi:hypothetical protein